MRHKQQMPKITDKQGLDIIWSRLAVPLSHNMLMLKLFLQILLELQGFLGSPALNEI